MASGVSPHCYDALKLTYGNTIDTIKQEHQKIADEQKAHGEAKRKVVILKKRRQLRY
jgi:hypothetical protein